MWQRWCNQGMFYQLLIFMIFQSIPSINYIFWCRRGDFTVIPVLVGSLSSDKESKYGHIFCKYLSDPSNLFVISSDFCHWGQRFRYTYYNERKGEIHESIKSLDMQVNWFFFANESNFSSYILYFKGMEIIENLDHEAFTHYLKKYGNTICGRHPIGVFLGAVQVRS